MKRTPIKRDTPKARDWLKRSKLATALRKTRLQKRGRKSAEKRKRDFGEKAAWVRRMGCLVCGTMPSDCHHDPPRSLGGSGESQVPLCRRHHNVRHQIGPKRFVECYEIDLKAEAARIESEWRAMQ